MCGIVAEAAGNNIVSILIEGLNKLECRDNGSARIAAIRYSEIEDVRLVGHAAGFIVLNYFYTTKTESFVQPIEATLKGELDFFLAAQSACIDQLSHISQGLAVESSIEVCADATVKKHHALHMGNIRHWFIRLADLLKQRGISYNHAGVNANAITKLKNGPFALVDQEMSLIAVASNDVPPDNLKANLKEVQAWCDTSYIDADSLFSKIGQIHVL